MTDRPERPTRSSSLRAAREEQGWSQSDAAGRLRAAAQSHGAPAASAASLKTQLSRWENGHALPEPHYRELLGALYGRTATELGLDSSPEPARGDGAARLRALLAAAAVVDDEVVGLWWEQLATARRLDDQLGAAGAGELLRVQVEQLDDTLVHTVAQQRRAAVAEVLAESAVLAGHQALDQGHPERAWLHYGRALTAAREAQSAPVAAQALAGQSAVLVEVGEPAIAVELLEHAERPASPFARARIAAALGVAAAAAGDATSARRCIDEAEAEADAEHAVGPIDLVRRSEGPVLELADVQRWRGHTLATLGDPGAIEPLEHALAAGPRAVRHRAELHADLALALATSGRADEASGHARTARQLAERIGSRRIPALLARGEPAT